MRIRAMYFSPTGTTKKVISIITDRITQNSEYINNSECFDFTSYEERLRPRNYEKDEILIIGVPVYAGRVPNILLSYLNSIKGAGTTAIPVVVYGNRNYDDALLELKCILESNGFVVKAAGAFIGEHAFSEILAKNRPDERDMKIINEFADKLVEVINDKSKKSIEVHGCIPFRAYYQPKDKNGEIFNFKKITPKTNENCDDCKICVKLCPMNSIDLEDVSKIIGICIKCCACIKGCHNNAKYFDDINYIKHRCELETEFEERREPDIFM